MASPARPTAKRIAAAPPPMGLLSDDLLAEILLCLPTLSDVARAAASCAAFRRVAAGRAFLRRLHSVHPAPLLGLILLTTIHPAQLPHSSAPYARAFAGRVDLSFSFLPSPSRCELLDARDGRVLLGVPCTTGRFSFGFVVCDPLSRRHTLLPQIPIPGDTCRFKPFLFPAASDEEAETSFRVFCTVKDAAEQLVPFVFSSATGQWSSLAVDAGLYFSPSRSGLRGYAYGCFYWKVNETDDLILFDTRSLEFSKVRIPFSQDHQQHQDHVIVEAGGGRLGVFSLDNSIISAVCHLVYAIQENNEDGSSSWRIERRIRLPSRNFFSIEDASDRYLLLNDCPWELFESPVHDFETGYFSLEFESMKIEKIYSMRTSTNTDAKLYAGFPPPLCLPSI